MRYQRNITDSTKLMLWVGGSLTLYKQYVFMYLCTHRITYKYMCTIAY